MITIREATESDIFDIYPIACSCFHQPWSEAALFDEIIRDTSVVVVAECDGKVVGFVTVTVFYDEGHITNVAVLGEYRRMGIASMMMDEAIKLSLERFELYLHTLEVRITNDAAIGLYTKKGFVAVGIRPNYYNDTNEDALLMSIIYGE